MSDVQRTEWGELRFLINFGTNKVSEWTMVAPYKDEKGATYTDQFRIKGKQIHWSDRDAPVIYQFEGTNALILKYKDESPIRLHRLPPGASLD